MRHQAKGLMWGALLALALPCAGCSAERPADAPGQRIEIAVAPLTLVGIAEAVYRITVRNAAAAPNNIVWQQQALSSIQYGNGKGALSYVGPCDASRNPHVVELELISLSDATHVLSSPAEYKNPAPPGSPIRRVDVWCEENADVSVVFDLTVLRSAMQGFFDIAVNFDDIFCSAKLDCVPQLLHDGDTRSTTVVLGFACTAGPGDATYMYLSDVTLTCKNADGSNPVATVLPVFGLEDGQQGPEGAAIFQWAQYSGAELLDQNEFTKCYRNLAIGIDRAALVGKRCSLSALGTASGQSLPGLVVPDDGAYPVIRWEVEVLEADGDICSNRALDVTDSGVWTSYITPDTVLSQLPALADERFCGIRPPIECGTATPVGGVVIRPDGQRFSVEISAGNATGTSEFTLPGDWAVATSCCEADCCDASASP